MNGSGLSDLPQMALRHLGQLFLGLDNLLHLRQKPGIDHGEFVNFLHCESCPECVTNEEYPFRIRNAKFSCDDVSGKNVPISISILPDPPRFSITTQSGASDLHGAKALLK